MIADGIPVRIPVSAALDDLRGVAGTLALAEQLRGLHVATVLIGGNVASDELKTLLSGG